MEAFDPWVVVEIGYAMGGNATLACPALKVEMDVRESSGYLRVVAIFRTEGEAREYLAGLAG